MTEMHPGFRAAVLQAIASVADVPVADLVDETNLLDLGLDSLEFSEILINIEDAVGEEVSMELLDNLDDLGDIVTVAGVCEFLAEWKPKCFAATSVKQL